jgi:nitrate reductase gamma subunit
LKKARVFLKMIVKHSLFDNALTLCVLLNTIIMGMEKYDMDSKMAEDLEFIGSVFTWIFIVELTSKVAAIGPRKYM